MDREECFTIRDTYTKETSAIIDGGRSFFGRNPVSTDFTSGTPFQFSVSCLDLITDAVRNALPVQRAIWTMQVPQELLAVAKQPQCPVAIQMPTVPPPSGWGTSPQQQQGGQQGSPRKSPPEDIHHPKI